MVFALVGCSHATRPDHGTFLTDYAQLRQTRDAQGHVYFAHQITAQPANPRATYAVSTEYFPAGTHFNGLSAQAQASLLAYLDHVIREQLQQRSMLASDGAQADIRLRVAITSVVAADPGLRPWDFLPIHLLLEPLKDSVLGAPKVASATLEVQAIDAHTGTVLNESARKDDGKSIGRQKNGVSVVTFGSLHKVLDQWATSVVSEQDPTRSRKK
ncbi:DUF3313 family protein [Frateuria sp. YIM B11624]|uniref:DUF3313 family protein n=1 Tax=Frateuria sp. YIM B11624 TaxID=3143185 RepID=UPI003C72D9ED